MITRKKEKVSFFMERKSIEQIENEINNQG